MYVLRIEYELPDARDDIEARAMAELQLKTVGLEGSGNLPSGVEVKLQKRTEGAQPRPVRLRWGKP